MDGLACLGVVRGAAGNTGAAVSATRLITEERVEGEWSAARRGERDGAKRYSRRQAVRKRLSEGGLRSSGRAQRGTASHRSQTRRGDGRARHKEWRTCGRRDPSRPACTVSTRVLSVPPYPTLVCNRYVSTECFKHVIMEKRNLSATGVEGGQVPPGTRPASTRTLERCGRCCAGRSEVPAAP